MNVSLVGAYHDPSLPAISVTLPRWKTGDKALQIYHTHFAPVFHALQPDLARLSSDTLPLPTRLLLIEKLYLHLAQASLSIATILGYVSYSSHR
eukprot:CAMPEP_0184361524 /NCGR_PEP_ID=MMETSP1089-20130417/130609_1 /TAXON_ID=38269 ORGANISM="Gloeochaete wittrockiana, Strain SAG46.84" /NCGR_SAMPLE_ID=MMETSP1089 /ASSEMBLY_ACC=CAM_ASM_000445 /LENGTH=93 /DNA_ID=CAMNT_0026701233 /DNA_START=16 /DNA_END=293 /DNA_ORIENTATION=-